ncbi:MAG TPA: TrbI/VirB10 family protein [Patescibacteria group bacterium]|nr:TrbI/VirB10 family protein [Patescibacteria group bacterium]
MTNNENDVDIDTQEDFDKEPPQKASFKDTWDNNPLLKIGALVVAIVLIAFIYVKFIAGEEEVTNNSAIGTGADKSLVNKVGQGVDDEVYRKAIEAENKRKAEEALRTQGSAMPTPIGTSQTENLSIPPVQAAPQGDPLAEWRQKAEARRLSLESEQPPPEDEAGPPEVQPIVTPIRPQATQKLDPAVAKQLSEQMRAIITTQQPKNSTRVRITKRDSIYVMKLKADKAAEEKRKQQEAEDKANGITTRIDPTTGLPVPDTEKAAKDKVIVPAGNIAYAQLLNDLNSDIDGPALAQVMSGPFEGGRAIGDFEKQDEYLTLNFKRIIKEGVSYSINGIALDEDTTLAAHQTDVDHHYFSRIVLPAAAAFLTGYTSAAAETGQTAVATGDTVSTNIPEPDPKQELMEGATQASTVIANILNEGSSRPITVYVKRGTTMGILFMDSVTTANAEK